MSVILSKPRNSVAPDDRSRPDPDSGYRPHDDTEDEYYYVGKLGRSDPIFTSSPAQAFLRPVQRRGYAVLCHIIAKFSVIFNFFP